MAAGGYIKQSIYKDTRNLCQYYLKGEFSVTILNSLEYLKLKGYDLNDQDVMNYLPKTVISYNTYIKNNYPWFDYYNENLVDVILKKNR